MKTLDSLLDLIKWALVAFVVWFVYDRFVAPVKSAVPSAEEVKQGAADIAAGLPGYIMETVTGQDDSGYKTREQQAAESAAYLAARRAAAGVM